MQNCRYGIRKGRYATKAEKKTEIIARMEKKLEERKAQLEPAPSTYLT